MRAHIGLHVKDLEAATRFYETLLGVKPARVLPGYAQFLCDRPALNLALEEEGHAPAVAPQHFGIEVDRVDDVAEAAKRLAAAGYAVDEENDRVCCYSRQTKVWTRDPDGRRWEVFYVIQRYDTVDGESEAACCGETASGSGDGAVSGEACCPAVAGAGASRDRACCAEG